MTVDAATHNPPPAATDPAVYASYADKWAQAPATAEAWLQRAREVAAVLAPDAAAREKANKTPLAEIALLKHAGLLRVLGPAKYGGGAQPFSVGLQVQREVAKADGSLGMLLGYHLLWSLAPGIVGTDEQADRAAKLIIGNNYFVGGAVNPRDADLKITLGDSTITYNGFKNFTTGAAVSDVIVLEGSVDGRPEEHIFAIVPTKQAGITFKYNWDAVGVRLTESGSANIENVTAPWADALGWDPVAKKPIAEVLTIPYASLLLPAIQSVFANLYVGVALGALEAAKAYTTKTTRPWPFGGENKEHAVDEFYILAQYGEYFARLRAAEALADRANAEGDKLFAKYAGNRAALTAEERGDWAEWVASIKVVSTETGLAVTQGVFEVTGARATATKSGLDRFWRDIRTHTLHDPVAYKKRELGRYVLLGEAPTPTWYT